MKIINKVIIIVLVIILLLFILLKLLLHVFIPLDKDGMIYNDEMNLNVK